MISDGIENCVQYVHNFNPEKSQNPFAYFTQIIHYAFLRRIQKEKKQLEIKNKILERTGFDQVFEGAVVLTIQTILITIASKMQCMQTSLLMKVAIITDQHFELREKILNSFMSYF